MRKVFQNIVLIGYFIHSFIININAQSFEKGGIYIGGNANIHFIDKIKYSEKNTNMNIDIDFGYLVTQKSFLGFKLDLYLLDEKTDKSYTHNNNWMSGFYYKTLLINEISIEIYSEYGKDHFKHKSRDGAYGSSDIHIAQFGTGIGFPQFISANIVLNPVIVYNHEIWFVKNIEEYTSNQHFNMIFFKAGLYYYFNINQKVKNNENKN